LTSTFLGCRIFCEKNKPKKKANHQPRELKTKSQTNHPTRTRNSHVLGKPSKPTAFQGLFLNYVLLHVARYFSSHTLQEASAVVVSGGGEASAGPEPSPAELLAAEEAAEMERVYEETKKARAPGLAALLNDPRMVPRVDPSIPESEMYSLKNVIAGSVTLFLS
jgi:hypothetical protein